jgi:EH domain-containing protein 1
LDSLTPLPNQTRRDSWASIRDLLYVNLKNSNGQYSLSQVLGEHATVKQIYDKGSREIREALKELAGITMDNDVWAGEGRGPVPYWANTEATLDSR